MEGSLETPRTAPLGLDSEAASGRAADSRPLVNSTGLVEYCLKRKKKKHSYSTEKTPLVHLKNYKLLIIIWDLT